MNSTPACLPLGDRQVENLALSHSSLTGQDGGGCRGFPMAVSMLHSDLLWMDLFGGVMRVYQGGPNLQFHRGRTDEDGRAGTEGAI